jgi:hypothetical protein
MENDLAVLKKARGNFGATSIVRIMAYEKGYYNIMSREIKDVLLFKFDVIYARNGTVQEVQQAAEAYYEILSNIRSNNKHIDYYGAGSMDDNRYYLTRRN